MAQFRVDSEQIQQAAAAVGTSVSAIRDAVNGMYTNLQQLQSVWTGSAATQFASTAQQWRAAQQQMEQSLEAIQQAMQHASGVYLDAETQATSLFGMG
uniref:WXG100 family type VII secretion target n=1 Tax=uncultured Gardnerella sp. TaxID=293424 RepID=UPI000E2EB07D|nr:WXG100 family type VII secretion target [uncultured Gardnerella sp.]